MDRPPCWPNGHPCPNPCAQAHYDRTVYNRHHLPDPWSGWRFAGRVLVSPDGDRITPERLRGILWSEAHSARKAARRQRLEAVSRMTDGLREKVLSLRPVRPGEVFRL